MAKSTTSRKPRRPELTIDQARGMHTGDLRLMDSPIAKQQLQLREAGAETVRAVMARWGVTASGTGGWHLIPCTWDGRIGWVDSAKGIAYLSETDLPSDQVVALTVPDQPTGCLHGGTSMQSADVTGASRVEIPTGWRQLVMDVRGGTPVEQPLDAAAIIAAYGLQTCYGDRGMPPIGWERIYEEIAGELAAEIQRIAAEWCQTVVDRLATRAGVADPQHCNGAAKGERLPHPLWPLLCASFPESLTHTSLDRRSKWYGDKGRAVARICDAADSHRYIACGYRYTIAALLDVLVSRRMRPILAAAAGIVPPEDHGGPDPGYCETWRPVIWSLLMDELQEMDAELNGIYGRLVATLYASGAVVTDRGRRQLVVCESRPAKPVAKRITLDSGHEAMHVPFGADCPAEYDHCLVLGAEYEIRVRAADGDSCSHEHHGGHVMCTQQNRAKIDRLMQAAELARADRQVFANVADICASGRYGNLDRGDQPISDVHAAAGRMMGICLASARQLNADAAVVPGYDEYMAELESAAFGEYTIPRGEVL